MTVTAEPGHLTFAAEADRLMMVVANPGRLAIAAAEVERLLGVLQLFGVAAERLATAAAEAERLVKVAAGIGRLTSVTGETGRALYFALTFCILLDPVNKESFELIETSLCIICLDEGLPTMFNQNPRIRKYRDVSNMMVQMLHGGGSKYFGANRWYDKTVQVELS